MLVSRRGEFGHRSYGSDSTAVEYRFAVDISFWISGSRAPDMPCRWCKRSDDTKAQLFISF